MRQNGALFVLTTLSLPTTYVRTLPTVGHKKRRLWVVADGNVARSCKMSANRVRSSSPLTMARYTPLRGACSPLLVLGTPRGSPPEPKIRPARATYGRCCTGATEQCCAVLPMSRAAEPELCPPPRPPTRRRPRSIVLSSSRFLFRLPTAAGSESCLYGDQVGSAPAWLWVPERVPERDGPLPDVPAAAS